MPTRQSITIWAVTILIVLSLMPIITHAVTEIQSLLDQAAGSQGAGYSVSPELADTGLSMVVGRIVRFFLSLVGVLFLVYVVYGGFLWMTAAGNEERVSKAKNIIRDGIIGIIITLSAGGIYYLVAYALNIGGAAPITQ